MSRLSAPHPATGSHLPAAGRKALLRPSQSPDKAMYQAKVQGKNRVVPAE
jgi:hypothetical protein